MNQEVEATIFARVSIFTMGLLRKLPYLNMVQGEVPSTTNEGLRIGNRVRMTMNPDGSEKVITVTTKFRIPRKEGSVVSTCPQVELHATQGDFEVIMGASPVRHVKRRYVFRLSDDKLAEIDVYVTNEETVDLSRDIKIDIGKCDEANVEQYLAELADKGIHLEEIYNPIGVESDGIKNKITQLITEEWNLKK